MIVTRFAPSPTGYLHIGGARTALFCWLHARHHSGKMLLRIEDTDQKRNTPTATQQVIDDLRWLGIQWDEGPEVGGPHGPYLQSQRLDLYNKYLDQLIEAKQAYYCFDSTEELQALRDEAQDEKKTFVYPRPERFPTKAQAAEARAAGRSVVVRFAMPRQDITVKDIVRGEVTFKAEELSDFIIQKSDGYPTYHFACVVDDELMQVTDVIRGQEHLMNTPYHIALQQALGFRTPQYAHISVTISEGGGKLSKRERGKALREHLKKTSNLDLDAVARAGQVSRGELDDFLEKKSELDGPIITAIAEHVHLHLPEINVVDFFHSGYLPETLINFVALLGWNPGDNREIMPLDELIAAFDINRLNKTNSLFDRKKLVAFNTEYLRLLPADTVLKHFKAYLHAVESPAAQADDATLARVLQVCQGARTFEDILQKSTFLFTDAIAYDEQAMKKVFKADTAAVLADVRTMLDTLPAWTETALHEAVEAFCTQRNLGMGKVAQPIRVAITGTTVSPGIGESLVMLGKEKTLRRIDAMLTHLKSQS